MLRWDNDRRSPPVGELAEKIRLIGNKFFPYERLALASARAQHCRKCVQPRASLWSCGACSRFGNGAQNQAWGLGKSANRAAPHPTAPASWRTPNASRGPRPRATQRAPPYGPRASVWSAELAPALRTAHEAGGVAEIRRAVAATQSASWLRVPSGIEVGTACIPGPLRQQVAAVQTRAPCGTASATLGQVNGLIVALTDTPPRVAHFFDAPCRPPRWHRKTPSSSERVTQRSTTWIPC